MQKDLKQTKNDTNEIDILIVEDSKTQSEQLKFLLEMNHYTAITADNNGIIVNSNQGTQRIFGFDESEIIGQPIMSHEIRTPMNGILGFSNLLVDAESTEQEKEKYIEAIEKSTQQLLQIITDIVDISKIESGQEKMCASAFNLEKLLKDIFSIYKPVAHQKGLQLSLNTNLWHGDKKVMGDFSKLRQVLINLIGNAVKFTEKGYIEIGVSANKQKIIFNIKDSGIGIDLSLYEAIFDRFRQVELTYSWKYGGNGLGLSIAKSYVEMMNGTIGVESIPGVGSTFRFELPLIFYFESVDVEEFENPEILHNYLWGNKTILLAEDEEFNSMYLEFLLKPTGVNIITAQNGIEAVEHCRNNEDISRDFDGCQNAGNGWHDRNQDHQVVQTGVTDYRHNGICPEQR